MCVCVSVICSDARIEKKFNNYLLNKLKIWHLKCLRIKPLSQDEVDIIFSQENNRKQTIKVDHFT